MRTTAATTCALLLLSSCGRIGFDLLSERTDVQGGDTGGSANGDASTADDGSSSTGGTPAGSGGSASGATAGAGGAASGGSSGSGATGGAPFDAASGGTAGTGGVPGNDAAAASGGAVGTGGAVSDSASGSGGTAGSDGSPGAGGAASTGGATGGGGCGNGTVDTGEQCDDGVETAACDADCTFAACGDGVVNATAGETCDEKGGQSAACDADCATPVACPANCACLAYEGRRHVMCNLLKDQPAAQSTCQLGRQDLVTVDDAAENAWIVHTASWNASFSNYWMGANDIATEGQWVWPGGTQFWQGAAAGTKVGGRFSIWDDAEPNNTYTAPADCGVTGYLGTWNDQECTAANHFVCESNVHPATTCGNGVVEPGEACDTAGDSVTCDADCTLPSCGDGHVNGSAGEACDTGPDLRGCAGCQIVGRTASNLLALYTFKEGSGTTVHDVSGVSTPLDLIVSAPASVSWSSAGLTILAAGAVASTTSGKITAAIQATGSLSLEAWVTASNYTSTGRGIVGIGFDPTNLELLLTQEGRRLGARMTTATTTTDGLPLTLGLALNNSERLHIVYTRQAGGAESLYLQGTLVTAGTRAGDLGGWNPAHPFWVGSMPNSSGIDFLGTLHLVAVYSAALGGDEVRQNYVAGP